MAGATLIPAVAWAQRQKIVFVTINVSDVTNPEIKVKLVQVTPFLQINVRVQVEKDSLYFKGTGGADHKVYEITMKLLKEIDPEQTKYQVRPRCVEFALEKVMKRHFNMNKEI